jgi:bis(5'-adenosyl)-triphosphatase
LHYAYLYCMNCPFCQPSIQEAVFARSENFLAVYNLAPIFPGHSLIIPVRHLQSTLELTTDELTEMMLFARSVTSLLLKAFKAEAFNWSIQDREAAGQTLAHLHMHIVMRYPGDLPDPGDWYPKIRQNYSEILDSTSREKLTPSELKKIVETLRSTANNSI